MILALQLEGRRQLVPFRARLLDGHPHRELRLAVSPLRQGAHELDELGSKPATYEGVTLLVDPTITDAITALWNSLVAFFSDKSYDLPPNPTYVDEDGHTYFVDGFDPEHERAATYKGPTSGDITNAADRARIQNEVADQSGVFSPFERDGLLSWVMNGDRYDGVALFDGAQAVVVDPSRASRVEVTNSAVFGMSLARLDFRNADVGGLNLRGTAADRVTIENSAFDMVDVTGAALGSETRTSTISNTVIEGLSGNETTRSPLDDNKPDTWEGRKPPSATSTSRASRCSRPSSATPPSTERPSRAAG